MKYLYFLNITKLDKYMFCSYFSTVDCFWENIWLFLVKLLVKLTWLWRTRRICVVKKREKIKKFVVWTLKPNEGGLRSEVNILAAIFAQEVVCEFPNCGVVIVQKRKNLWVTKSKLKCFHTKKFVQKKSSPAKSNLCSSLF